MCLSELVITGVSRSMYYVSNFFAGELAPAILATVNMSGNIVDFYIVHFGNEEWAYSYFTNLASFSGRLKNCAHALKIQVNVCSFEFRAWAHFVEDLKNCKFCENHCNEWVALPCMNIGPRYCRVETVHGVVNFLKCYIILRKQKFMNSSWYIHSHA